MKAMLPSFKILTVLFLVMYIQAQVKADRLTKPNEPGPWPSLKVNTYTGNLFHQRSDLHIPTLGEIPLDLTFSYNSLQNQSDVGYGNGWSFSFGLRYTITGNTLTITRDDGEQNVFTWNGSVYQPPVGIYDSIREYLPGKYLLKSKYGIRYYFDDPAYKKLTKIVDRNGNATMISYTSGKPTTITDPSGRVFNLGWVGDHLSQITDPNTTPDRIITFQYDDSGNMIQVTRALGNIFQYGYDSNRNMTSVTDPRSNTVTISYNANGAVASISCPDASYNKTFEYDNCDNTTTVSQIVSLVNRETIYTFDLNGRVISKRFPDGNSVSYTWDPMNNIISETNENGAVTNYTYDSRANLVIKEDCRNSEIYYEILSDNNISSYTDKNGSLTTYNYNANGNMTDMTDCLGNTESYNYDISGNMINAIDKNGILTTFNYDTYGNLTSTNYPMGYTASNTYDPVGNMLTSTDKRGFTTTYTYDLLDRHTGTLDALGYTSSYSYDGNGNLVSETNQDANTTTYSYDALNRKISKTDALSGITSYIYDEAGNKISETNANGCTTMHAYNLRNRLTSTTDPLGGIESYTLDPEGLILTSTDKGGHTTNYAYDCLGRLITTTDPNGFTETAGYDPVGNKTSFTDKNGNSTTYAYDCLDRLISISYLPGYSEYFTYDAVGRKSSFTDKNGNVTTYSYDAFRRLITETDPLLLFQTFIYDGEGNMTSSTDKNGNTTTYAYDGLNRRISKTDALSFTESYIYDGVGNRLFITDKRGNTANYAYDGLSRLISSTDPLSFTETYTYDAMGNQISVTDKNGNTTTNTYDCNNQQISILDPLGGSETFTYSAAGHVTGYTDKNGSTTNWDYSCCQLASTTDPLGHIEDYAYDQAGNRISLTDRNGDITTYQYDNLNRLIKSIAPMGNQTLYSLDGNGNILSKTDANLNTIIYSYNDRNELITTTYPDASSLSYIYDNNGNLTQSINTGGIGETVTYAYDALNRLITKVTNYGAFSKTITYTHDQNGNCTSLTIESGTINYQYDADNKVIQITDQDSRITTFEYDDAGHQTAVNYPNGVSTLTSYDALGRVAAVVTTDTPPPFVPVPPEKRPEPAKSDQILLNIDCAVIQILSPVSGPGLTASEPVTIMMVNYGIIPVFNAVAQYSIDGGTPVIQNVSQPLFPGNPITFTFTQHADLSIPGHTYQLVACVMAAGDLNPSNDCMMATIVNQAPIVYESFTYQYDAIGNKVLEVHEDESFISFNYSVRNELLTELFFPSGDYNYYTYTPTGKRASIDENGNLSLYTYNDDDVLIAAGDAIFTPDNNGNRITKTDLSGTTHYFYGYRNELEHVTLPDLSFVEYKYDALGRPVRKNVFGVENSLLSDGNELLEEYDATGILVRYYDPGLSIQEGSLTGFYHYNGFGSTTLQSNPEKAILATNEFDAFGNIRGSSGTWIDNAYKFNHWIIQQDIGLYDGAGGDFADPVTGDKLGTGAEPKKGKTEVTQPESGKPETVTGGGKSEEKKKVKCCGVKKFEVKWSKPSGWYLGQMLRIDVDIEFMNDEEHAPACCEYCQNVMSVFNVTAGPDKGWKGDTSPMHDDHYSRGINLGWNVYGSDDTDGNDDLDDAGFKTDDNPGLRNLDPKSDVDYSFTAEQLVKEACGPPCPTGTVVAKRGPHTATVKGKEPRAFTGVPATLDKDVK